MRLRPHAPACPGVITERDLAIRHVAPHWCAKRIEHAPRCGEGAGGHLGAGGAAALPHSIDRYPKCSLKRSGRMEQWWLLSNALSVRCPAWSGRLISMNSALAIRFDGEPEFAVRPHPSLVSSLVTMRGSCVKNCLWIEISASSGQSTKDPPTACLLRNRDFSHIFSHRVPCCPVRRSYAQDRKSKRNRGFSGLYVSLQTRGNGKLRSSKP